jgi:hypothetical protein
VLFVGHSAKTSLPRATLGKVLHSVTRSFTECRTLGTEEHSANTSLPSALGKDFFVECRTLGKCGARQRAVNGRLKLMVVTFAEGRRLALSKEDSLPSAHQLALG